MCCDLCRFAFQNRPFWKAKRPVSRRKTVCFAARFVLTVNLSASAPSVSCIYSIIGCGFPFACCVLCHTLACRSRVAVLAVASAFPCRCLFVGRLLSIVEKCCNFRCLAVNFSCFLFLFNFFCLSLWPKTIANRFNLAANGESKPTTASQHK